VPDIRSERVIALREQLNSGSYQVTASDIAAKIFGVDA
jgi:anti-sigma28 factor (negative regulator of flagellin synthesis)